MISISDIASVARAVFSGADYKAKARATMISTFNAVRQRVEDQGQKLQGIPEDSRIHSPYLTGLLNEIEYLAQLVREKDVAMQIFESYYGSTFLIYYDTHLPDMLAIRKEQPNAFEHILWLERQMRPWRHLDAS